MTEIQSLPTNFPILDYAPVPGTSDQVLLTLDTTFGNVAFNQEAGIQKQAKGFNISDEQREKSKRAFVVVQVGSDGIVSYLAACSTGADICS